LIGERPVQEAQEMWAQSLGQENPLEKEMPAYFSILAWKIPWTEEPRGLQFMGLQRVRQKLSVLVRTHTHTHTLIGEGLK